MLIDYMMYFYDMEKSKALIILGTRPEAIKLIPLYLKLKESEKWQPILISTGQHKEMLIPVFELFNVVPDEELNVMTPNQTLSGLTAKLFVEVQKSIDKYQPKLIIVQGDTQTSFVGAYCGYYNKVKIAHVEAGLRTNDIYSPFPEEVNRQAVSIISDYDFTPTDPTTQNLLSLNKKNVHNVGNTVIDALQFCKRKVSIDIDQYYQKFTSINLNKKLILITGHRRENFGKPFENVLNSIKSLSTKYPDFEFVFPVHLNPVVKSAVKSILEDQSNIKLIDPLPYDEMVFLMLQSYIIITDSGGIQEEAPSLNIPVLVTRESTERQEGVDAGCLILVGTDSHKIESSFDLLVEDSEFYKSTSDSLNPYGNGTTSQQIVTILDSNL
ncbi:MAG: UDP-N-acetylglucosamine 2-epimerase (non-hydrolyzing) [Flavobacteriales bacterium]|jgi:UDP-N-acetylglucosamine 2-epimerase (non-hydrolysing)